MTPRNAKATEVLKRLGRTKFNLEKVNAEGKGLSFEIPIIAGDPGDNVVCKLTVNKDTLNGQMWEAQADERKSPLTFKKKKAGQKAEAAKPNADAPAS